MKNSKKKSNSQTSSTITFGELVEIAQQRLNSDRAKRGLPPRKIELITDPTPTTTVRMFPRVNKVNKKKSLLRKILGLGIF